MDRVARLDFCRRIHFRQCGRRLAHVQLAGDHVGDQPGAVLVKKCDLAYCGLSCASNLRNTDSVTYSMIFTWSTLGGTGSYNRVLHTVKHWILIGANSCKSLAICS